MVFFRWRYYVRSTIVLRSKFLCTDNTVEIWLRFKVESVRPIKYFINSLWLSYGYQQTFWRPFAIGAFDDRLGLPLHSCSENWREKRKNSLPLRSLSKKTKVFKFVFLELFRSWEWKNGISRRNTFLSRCLSVKVIFVVSCWRYSVKILLFGTWNRLWISLNIKKPVY